MVVVVIVVIVGVDLRRRLVGLEMLGSSFPNSDVWVAHDQRASGWHDDHPSLL